MGAQPPYLQTMLQERLFEDLKKALRSGDEVKRSVIRLARAAIKNAEIERGRSLTDEEVLGVLAKEASQRRESIAEFRRGRREDLATREEQELAILLGYLPAQLSREEIASVARQVIAEVDATGPKDMGKVMSRLMVQLRGKAEGREVNTVVTELLGGR